MMELIQSTAAYLNDNISIKPKVGIILGSGLGGLVNAIDIQENFDYDQIPNFPVSTVEGHHGRLIFGLLDGKEVVAMQGRFHYYEGYTMQQVTFPVRVMKQLGITHLFLSNAAGGLNPEFSVGDLMIIRDQINMFPENPLRGKNLEELGPRFPEMGEPFHKNLIDHALEIGANNNIKLQTGTYIGSAGPTLETPAEYKMFRILGADATGMSTVPEVIVARHMGLYCFGISIITNMAVTEDMNKGATHDEVQDAAAKSEPKLTKIFRELIRNI